MTKHLKNYDHYYSPHAALAGIGAKILELDLLQPIKENLRIKQKTVKRSPFDKICDALVSILAGAHGLVEINTLLRSDQGLQKAFGRSECAEQSVVQMTLNCCTTENVGQMMRAVKEIIQAHSQTSWHHWKKQLLVIDLDMTGMPCGRKAEGSLKGYQGECGIRYGRQMCRALAAQYEEVIVDRLYPGNMQLNVVVPWMMADLAETLKLNKYRKNRTVIRMDAGGGNYLDYLLKEGYQVHAKETSSIRARNLSAGVSRWTSDPDHPKREMGWFSLAEDYYCRPVRKLIFRWTKDRSGELNHACLVSSLEPRQVLDLLGLPEEFLESENAVILAYSKLYDLRGGCVEIEFKESKGGIGITKRSKQRFAAQQMVMLLGQLAHNIIVWSRRWIAETVPKLKKYGALRTIRDLFRIGGRLEYNKFGILRRITLNRYFPNAQEMVLILTKLLKSLRIEVMLSSP